MISEELDSLGRSPLHYAAMNNDIASVKKLLAAGADPNRAELREHYTPLHLAVQDGAVDAIKLLLEAGADVHAVVQAPKYPATMKHALDLAVLNWRESPDGTIIKLLIAAGADKQALDGKGITALQLSNNLFRFPSDLQDLLR